MIRLMLRAILLILGLITLLIATLYLVSPVRPVLWDAPPNPGFNGVFSVNDRLAVYQQLDVQGYGPEDVSCAPSGGYVTGLDDGRIVKVSESGAIEELGNTGGRPLGIHALADGSVLIADAERGLLKLANGQVALLADEVDGAQMMKPLDKLPALLEKSVAKGMFGTKMRSVIKEANSAGVDAVVDQQFEIGLQILGHGLMPIIEPEVDIHSPTKVECEEMLKAAIHRNLDALDDGTEVMLKLSLPSIDNFYADLIDHPKVLKVVALSGGYSRDESNEILARQNGMIASFSRALAEGLSAKQTDDEFNTTLDATIASIAAASAT